MSSSIDALVMVVIAGLISYFVGHLIAVESITASLRKWVGSPDRTGTPGVAAGRAVKMWRWLYDLIRCRFCLAVWAAYPAALAARWLTYSTMSYGRMVPVALAAWAVSAVLPTQPSHGHEVAGRAWDDEFMRARARIKASQQ